MNDFEDKLRSRKFLPPPAAVRREVLAAGAGASAPDRGSWLDWLWPSPLAWGAVGVLLLGAVIFNASISTSRGPAHTARTPSSGSSEPASYAFFQDRQDLSWLLGKN